MPCEKYFTALQTTILIAIGKVLRLEMVFNMVLQTELLPAHHTTKVLGKRIQDLYKVLQDHAGRA